MEPRRSSATGSPGIPFVGLILDTGMLVSAERRGHSVSEILEQLQNAWGEVVVGLAAVTVVELTHGINPAPNGSAARCSSRSSEGR